MPRTRLDLILRRNRNGLALDLAAGALLVAILLFSGLSFGAELPKLSTAPAPVAEPATESEPAEQEAPCPGHMQEVLAELAGSVVDQLGRPLAGVLVIATGSADETAELSVPVTETGADGSFALRALRPGRYVLFAIQSEPAPATSEPLVVDPDFPTRLRLVVNEPATQI
jgi:hypothetical protein